MSIIFAGDFFYNSGKEPKIAHGTLRKAIKGNTAFM